MRKNQTNGFGTNVNNLTTAKFASITAKKTKQENIVSTENTQGNYETTKRTIFKQLF